MKESALQSIVRLMEPNEAQMKVLEELDKLGHLESITAPELRMVIDGKPPSFPRPQYMRWYRCAKKWGLDTTREVSAMTREQYNKHYYLKKVAPRRGPGALHLVANRLAEISQELAELQQYVQDVLARRQSKLYLDRPERGSGSERKPAQD